MYKSHPNLYNMNVQESPKPIQCDCTRVTQTYTIPMYKSHPNLYNTNEQESSKPIHYECTRVIQTYTI